MVASIAKRAFGVLHEEGPGELGKASLGTVIWRLDPQFHHRFRFHTLKNHLQNCIRYDAPPGPFKTIEIRPSEIENRISWLDDGMPLQRVKYKGIARTKSGDWDTDEHKLNLEDQFIISGFTERFAQDLQWEETTYYEKLRNEFELNHGYNNVGFNTVEEYLRSRCSAYDELYEEIKSNGYTENHKGESKQPDYTQPVTDRLEVLITIDRRGKVHFFEGHHRFAIARVLDIEIPAHVVCRHEKWQELRDEVYNYGLSEEQEELRNHPDLQHILN